jgi:threonyl-tRNA synthetase
MRFLAWHVDYVRAEPTERGRSGLAEEPNPVRAENALLVFANFEKNDESHQSDVTDKTISEIASIANQLKITAIVLNPFAHLFAEPSRPQVAIDMLAQLHTGLVKRNFDVQRLAFGMFYELELKAKGHRLSRIARSIS